MRFIHTADWHLGRLFHQTHLTEDQAHVLDQLVGIANESRVDAVLVAGDIYDRAVPPPDAVELLDDVLSRIVLGIGTPVVLIAGNHDSADRLNFASRLLEGRGLHVRGHCAAKCAPIIFNDAAGPVHVYPLPFAEAGQVRHILDDDAAIVDHQTAMAAQTKRIREALAPGLRSILIGHAFVVGGLTCESERPLSVGGAGTVDASVFSGFQYTALGHLHAPQVVGSGDNGASSTVRYSGSLLKYSFDECTQQKGVHIVEMNAAGECSVETIPLTPRRDVRRIKGMFADLVKSSDGMAGADYVEITLLDDGPVIDAMGRLRAVWPNAMNVLRQDSTSVGAGAAQRIDVRGQSELELFELFYEQITGEALGVDHRTVFVDLVDRIRMEEREAVK